MDTHMDPGWVKLWRKIKTSPVFTTKNNLSHLALWCMVKAQYEPISIRGIALVPGQFVTGRIIGADETGLKQATWYKGMKLLEKFGFISLKSSSQYTIVTLCNWGSYQSDEINSYQESSSIVAAKEQRSSSIVALGKEGKKKRKQEEKKHPLKSPKGDNDRFDLFWREYPRHEGKDAARRAFDRAISRIVRQDGCTSGEAAACLLVSAREFSASPKGQGTYVPHAATWLNGGRWMDDRADWQKEYTNGQVPLGFDGAIDRWLKETANDPE